MFENSNIKNTFSTYSHEGFLHLHTNTIFFKYFHIFNFFFVEYFTKKLLKVLQICFKKQLVFKTIYIYIYL